MGLSEARKRQIEEEELYRIRLAETAKTVQGEQKYGVPALLSFLIFGLGQIIKGEVGKGIGLMVAQFFIGLLCFVVIGIIPYIILWIWNIVDAYNHVPVKS